MARQTRSRVRTQVAAAAGPKRPRKQAATVTSSTTRKANTNSSRDNEKTEPPAHVAQAATLSQKKLSAWSQYSDSSPFPDFPRPTPEECRTAHGILDKLHGETVRKNFAEDEDGPMKDGVYTSVMDALVVAAVSQATSWANAKRAMASMEKVYGSTFAYQDIVDGGVGKLTDALRPGGMQNRKSKILMGLLVDVKARHGKWDLQHLFNASDEEVIKEVVSYWGLGPKCAHCLMSICLKRTRFAVDTHIYRLSGLWGWRPTDASVEKTQAHLDFRMPNNIKFMLHYQMIVHGRECGACRGGKTSKTQCQFLATSKEIKGEK